MLMMQDKERYESPEIEVVIFESEDVITASNNNDEAGHNGIMLPTVR